MPKTKTILITGAHHTPAIELIRQLKLDPKIDWNVEYIGHIYPTETHILHTIVPKLKVTFHNLESGKLDRRWLPNTIRGIPKTINAIFQSLILVNQINPDIVVSFGGFISVPVIIASYILKKPSITHEQTSTLSLSTKINSNFANKVALSFNPTSKLPSKFVVTGNLLRYEIFNHTTSAFKNLQPHLSKYPLIYITGGNQGSSFFNTVFSKIIPTLSKSYTIIHQTGNCCDQPLPQTSRYYPVKYVNLEDIGWVLHHSSIVISRAGANICQEIVSLNKSSILIPLPVSQQNEQVINARWVKSNLPTNTIISLQATTTPENIFKSIDTLSKLKPLPTPTKPQPNLQLLKLIHEII